MDGWMIICVCIWYRRRLKRGMCGRLRSRIWEERKGVMICGGCCGTNKIMAFSERIMWALISEETKKGWRWLRLRMHPLPLAWPYQTAQCAEGSHSHAPSTFSGATSVLYYTLNPISRSPPPNLLTFPPSPTFIPYFLYTHFQYSSIHYFPPNLFSFLLSPLFFFSIFNL